MPKTKRKTTRITLDRNGENKDLSSSTFLDKIQVDLENKNTLLNLILGVLIILVGGILVFNYFNKNKDNLTPAAETQNQSETPAKATDVNPNALPGKYSVKEGDTLFSIAQKYYQDGYKYPQLVETNKLANENDIKVGQVLSIPKLASASASTIAALTSPSPTAKPSSLPTSSPSSIVQPSAVPATGGAVNETIWGQKITGNTYTVVAGDWLSKIAGRSYGDIYAYQKIAQANNISNPDLIEPGTVLKIPR